VLDCDGNGDGTLDVVVADYLGRPIAPRTTQGGIEVRLGNGDGTFGAPTFTDVGTHETGLELVSE
jgi:hypothetical protein